ncbi:MAG: hypothetical protein Q4A52_07290 [Bacillota bacterium]|nr:hypothetical protein [Bacillota bacterium]
MLSAGVLAPLQNKEMNVVLDVGGDDVGARVLAYYREYFTPESCDLLFVVNAYREFTQDVESAFSYLRKIEDTIGFPVTGLISNAHLLRDTSAEDIEYGYRMTEELAKRSGVPVRYYAGIKKALDGVAADGKQGEPFEIGMHLRTRWQ